MKTFNFKTLLAALLLLCSSVLCAQDISITVEGFYFNGIYYRFAGGNTVSVGKGNYSGDIEIPETVICNIELLDGYYTVTGIADRAFENCTELTSVTIPSTVKTIGEWAFYNCTALTNITIGNRVKTIGNYAFYNCTALTSIRIPASVTSINLGAFFGCTGIKDIIIEDGTTPLFIDVKWWGNAYHGTAGAFMDSSLETLYLGRQITYPDDSWTQTSPFYSTSLRNVTITNNVTNIGNGFFKSCSNLESITIPNSVTYIGDYAFSGCGAMICELIIPDSVTYIGESAFYNCSSLTGNLTIPQKITTINNYAFYNCSGLTGLSIPNSVTSIGESAFYGCSNIAGKIAIPNGVSVINKQTFANCSKIEGVRIPSSVTSIDYAAFYGCTGIKDIIIEDGTTPLYMAESYNYRGLKGTFRDSPLDTLYLGRPITYPYNDYNKCSPFSSTSLRKVTFGESVSDINDCMFSGCRNLESITIPSNATFIGYNAFSDCESLTSITIPNSVTTIGDNAFCYCYSLTSATIGNSVETIGKRAFSNTAIASIIIPNCVTTIGEGAFEYCGSLASVTIPNSVTTIGENAFRMSSYDCSLNAVHISNLSAWCKITFPNNESSPLLNAHNLYLNGNLVTDLVIPSDITEIKDHTFQGCNSITSVRIHDRVTRVGIAAFEWCGNLTGELIIPNSVTRIEGWAFKETNITGLKLGKGLTHIGNDAFYRCHNLTGELVIPDGVETIDSNAFFGCYNLCGELTIPNSVKTIGGSAFQGANFTSLKMGNGVESIGGTAFADYGSKGSIKDVYITDLAAWCRINFNAGNANPLNGGANLHLNGKLLTSLAIPDDVTEIKQYAFYNCLSIDTIDFGNVTSIGNSAFYNCYNLAGELIIPNSVTVIDYSAFANHPYSNGLTSIVFGDGITELKGGTFARCNNIKEITFGKNIERIEKNTFENWSYSSLTFNSDTVKDWFRNSEWVTEVHFGGNVKAITEGAFANCNIDSVHITTGITSIGDYAFSWNKNLRKLTVAPENSVYNAIEEHNVIMETATNKVVLAGRGATIPNHATSIGNGAFNGLLGVNELIIPASIESIGDWAFDGCEELKTVINYSGLLLTKGSIDHGYVAYYAENVTNITGIVDDYVFLTIDTANYLIDYIGETDALVLPNDFNGEDYTIVSGAFKNKKAITNITLSNGVTEIGDSAFARCTALEELNISATVGKIGKGITAECNALAAISVAEWNTTFDSREECNAVISNIEYIASGDTTWVATTSPEAGNTYILECPLFNKVQGVRKALYNKNGSIVEWKTLDETDDSFLWKVESTATGNVLKSVKDGRYLIGKEYNETNWTLESSSTGCEFSIIALDGNEVSISITNRHLHAGGHQEGNGSEGRIVSWETNSANSASAWVFVEQKIDNISQCANTLVLGCKTTIIPESVVAIGEGAFCGVQELQSITIPASVTAIGKEAFKGCSRLETIYCKGTTPATIYGNTFSNYNATLYVPTGSKEAYQAASYWSNFVNIVEEESTTLPGDITGDNVVNVGDITTIAAMILDESLMNDAADINDDGVVNVGDITTLVSMILGSNSAPARAAATRSADAPVVSANFDEEGTMLINVFNPGYPFTAAQFDLSFEGGISVVTDGEYFDVFLGSRTTSRNHSEPECNTQPDGSLRVVILSLKNKLFDGTEGDIANINLDVTGIADGEYKYTIKNIVLSDPQSQIKYPADVEGSLWVTATGIDSITAGSQNCNEDIYDLSGRKVANPVKGGIYIKGGKKFIM